MSFKAVIARKPHICSACGGEISEGEEAVVELDWRGRYPATIYCHTDGRAPNKIGSMSFNDIRREICSKKR